MAQEKSLSGSSGKISVKEGIRLTTNWRQLLTETKQPFQVLGFLIPADSIKQLLANNPDAEGVRAYVGLDDPARPESANLVLVPVVNGDDIIFIPGSNRDEGDEDDSNLYDRATPCPPICAPPNDLNS